MSNSTNVTTGKVRLSFVHLLKPFAFKPDQEEKYSCTMLIPKSDSKTLNDLNAAIKAATELGVSGKWGGVKPPRVAIPLYDGDGERPSDGAEFGPECKGHYVITASVKADYPPEVVDQNVQAILSPSEVYSGMYARVNVNFFPYNYNGKKGIGCGLGPVQKLADGEPLGGSAPKADAIFTREEDTSQINPLTGLPM